VAGHLDDDRHDEALDQDVDQHVADRAGSDHPG
jgi:hypothetical protein